MRALTIGEVKLLDVISYSITKLLMQNRKFGGSQSHTSADLQSGMQRGDEALDRLIFSDLSATDRRSENVEGRNLEASRKKKGTEHGPHSVPALEWETHG